MSAFQTLDDLDPAGKRILLRADLNVPMADGKVTDRTLLERLVPTIAELTERITLLSFIIVWCSRISYFASNFFETLTIKLHCLRRFEQIMHHNNKLRKTENRPDLHGTVKV